MPAIDDEDRPKKKIVHEIGQDLTLISVKELEVRLRSAERPTIARLIADIRAKRLPPRGADQLLQEIAGKRGRGGRRPRR